MKKLFTMVLVCCAALAYGQSTQNQEVAPKIEKQAETPAKTELKAKNLEVQKKEVARKNQVARKQPVARMSNECSAKHIPNND